jgi:hypothetical protein
MKAQKKISTTCIADRNIKFHLNPFSSFACTKCGQAHKILFRRTKHCRAGVSSHAMRKWCPLYGEQSGAKEIRFLQAHVLIDGDTSVVEFCRRESFKTCIACFHFLRLSGHSWPFCSRGSQWQCGHLSALAQRSNCVTQYNYPRCVRQSGAISQACGGRQLPDWFQIEPTSYQSSDLSGHMCIVTEHLFTQWRLKMRWESGTNEIAERKVGKNIWKWQYFKTDFRDTRYQDD